jgi:hypothetical protein
MKEKIFVILIGILLLVTISPTTIANETQKQIKSSINSAALCQVKIIGRGSEFFIMDSFAWGSGTCVFMMIELEKDGYIEIFSLTDLTNPVKLEGKHIITLLGFIGDYSHLLKIRLDGYALFAVWS